MSSTFDASPRLPLVIRSASNTAHLWLYKSSSLSLARDEPFIFEPGRDRSDRISSQHGMVRARADIALVVLSRGRMGYH